MYRINSTFFLLISALLLVSDEALSQSLVEMTFDGEERSFILHKPASYCDEKSHPLVLVLHGLMQTPERIMRMTNFNEIADREGFLAVYPVGLKASWNASDRKNGADDIAFLSGLIDSLGSQYSIDHSRVYVCGFSNGGFMSYKLACELPEKITAMASVAGTMWRNQEPVCQPDYAVPVLQIHGTDDMIVGFDGNDHFASSEEVVKFWKLKNGCTDSGEVEVLLRTDKRGEPLVERVVYGPCLDQSEVVMMVLHGGGHIWPGSTVPSIFSEFFSEFEASEEIWLFFSRFYRDSSGVIQRSK